MNTVGPNAALRVCVKIKVSGQSLYLVHTLVSIWLNSQVSIVPTFHSVHFSNIMSLLLFQHYVPFSYPTLCPISLSQLYVPFPFPTLCSQHCTLSFFPKLCPFYVSFHFINIMPLSLFQYYATFTFITFINVDVSLHQFRAYLSHLHRNKTTI